MMFIMLGPPVCGKGTQSRILAQKIHARHISAGDLLRYEVEKKSELGIKIQDLIDNGDYVDNELIFSFVKNKIAKGENFVLDGYPRNLIQAELLDNYFSEIGYGVYKVIKFDIGFDELYDRVINRMTCSECGEIYNRLTSPPKLQGICDKCGSRNFNIRPDDKVDVLKKRIVHYEKQISPLIDFYTQRGLMYNVDASKNINEVAEQILYMWSH